MKRDFFRMRYLFWAIASANVMLAVAMLADGANTPWVLDKVTIAVLFLVLAKHDADREYSHD